MSKTLVCGDIHGGYLALVQALKRAEFNIQKDKILFLGDYVDGWSQSFEVVEELISIKEVMGDRAIFLRGNHDIWVEEWLEGASKNPIWLSNGGTSTIKSYEKSSTLNSRREHLMFYKDLKDWYLTDSKNLFVHAGFDISSPSLKEGLEKQDMYGNKRCHWDRDLIAIYSYHDKNSLDIGEIYPDLKNIFIGHTPTININKTTLPYNFQNLWNIDTGAGWGGPLTVMNLHTKEYFQSDRTDKLYFNEKGR